MNDAVINALKALVTRMGGTVPTQSGSHWNQYTLDLLAAAITAAGGTPAARTGTWNDNFAALLGQLSTSVTPISVATGRRLADYTEYDPGLIKLSAADTTIGSTAGYIAVGLTRSGTAGALPNTGLSHSIVGRQMGGAVMDSDILSLLAAVAVWAGTSAPGSPDLCIGAAMADGPAQTATIGFGVRLSYSGGVWQVSHLTASGGVWTATAATATSASVVGGIASATHLSSTTQRSTRAKGMDSAGVPISTTNTQTLAATTTLGNNLTHLILYAGWLTGVGGVNGTVVPYAGREMSLNYNEISGYQR